MKHENHAQTSKSIFRSVIYTSLTWILPVGVSFIATPIIVRSLGNNDYGIYALVLGIISYSFTFNFGRAITKYIAEYRVSGESEKIRDVISASVFLNLIIGFIGVLVMCLLANWLVRDVFQIDAASQNKTVYAIYIASGIILLWMLTQVSSSVLQGIQRFDVFSKIFTANSLTLTLGNLTLAYFNFGLLALLSWNLLVLLLFFLVYGFAAKRLFPEFGIRFRFERETLRLVLRYSAGVAATQILANILLLFERGWITHRLGTEDLTYYVVPMSIGLLLHGFISSLVLVIFPLASSMINERDKLLRLYTKATKVICLIVTFVVISVLIQSKLFLFLWMGETFSHRSSSLLDMHILSFGLFSILTVSWQITEGLGFPQLNALATGICTVLGILLMVILIGDFGNFGVALARLTAMTTIFSSIFIVEKRYFDKVQVRFWMSLTLNLTIAAILAAIIQYATTSYLPGNWPTLFLSVFLGGSAYCFVLWFLDFVTADERLLIRRVFSK